jgi:hypothetical protein
VQYLVPGYPWLHGTQATCLKSQIWMNTLSLCNHPLESADKRQRW